MNIGLVVARFNEDLSWVDNLNFDNKYIYNKGDDEIKNNIKLPNKGREAHTYLTHIVNNYDRLDDITIFTQGNPDHVNNINDFNSIENLQGYKSFVNYYGKMVNGEVISMRNQPGSYWMSFYSKSQVTPSALYQFLYNERIPDCWVAVCAIFAVDKMTIQKHNKEKYIELLSLFERPDSSWMAYVLEYSWTLIFNKNGLETSFVGDQII